ncbi:phosphate:acyl-[acyl carrier protein] acyltransferase [Caminicella sporogenes DSM 14501]|uniref:Phosphate acyltransferase n=1 Tax=Caminicella sporogenes DSM 14501 TaxID=1121266 RepID=A0A1M6LFK0_9FIRM|nr:phosphate acyltransferase PlsX [Caminicella sporogenes]RKD27818.1 phosphate acyltransferase [Caminicella sporogenes]WIF94608.1 phosphate acyltransferase PlsX [Caminicella sporogenes]SHJ70003.1 phosphate:acyl-[acyl carrier protein] acyltransferase [Caminicella sporogenes DSM 14501]
MKIAVDIMGGDNAPTEIIKGSIQALKEINSSLILVGQEKVIKKEIAKYTNNFKNIEIVNADEIITNEDKPVQAVKRKKNSSMIVGLDLVKKREADCFISAGNTGALLVGSLMRVGRIKGIDRPALAPIYPTKKGFSLLVDAGANSDCKPHNLLEFAVMGLIYAEKVLKIEKPKIGLINIGIEKGKGNKLINEAFSLLEDSNLNFIGNVEARNLPEGLVDVIVCDGFTGNIVLKLTEGVAKNMAVMLKQQLMNGIVKKLAAFVLKDVFKNFKSKLDYTEYGGAPLLGIKGAVVKAHGSSNSKAIKNAIKYGEIFAENKVIENIEEMISRMGVDKFE